MLKYFLVFLIGLISISAVGQEPLYSNYQKFDTETGLPQSFPTAVVQDKDGFIWISTLNGLARYDGANFIHFNLLSKKTSNPSTSQLMDLIIDEDNYLWIANFNGTVDRMNPRTFEIEEDVKPSISVKREDFAFTFHFSTPYGFAHDPSRNNWMSSTIDDIRLYKPKNAELKKLFSIRTEGPKDVNLGFYIDKLDRTWLLTYDSLKFSKKGSSDFKAYPLPTIFKHKDIYLHPADVNELKDGRIIFGYQNQLLSFDEATETFTKFLLPELPERKNLSNGVYQLIKDHEGRIIFNCKGIVYRIEDDDSLTVLWEHPERNIYKMAQMFLDRSNTLWLPINTGGLYKIDLNTPSFNPAKYEVNFVVDILTNNLLYPKDNLPENWFINMWAYGLRSHYTKSNDLYLTQESDGYGNSLKIYKVEDKKFISLPLPDNDTTYIIGIGGEEEDLWALDINGWIYHWDDIRKVPEYKMLKLMANVGEEGLRDMVVDENNQWVISVKNKLYQLEDGNVIETFHPGTGNFSLIDMCQDAINPNIIWISTLGGGFIKWDKESKKTIKIYTEGDGLSNNSVATIIPDSLGYLWIATFNGISRFNTTTAVFTNYNKADGLFESEFNRHHGFNLPDGRIALGGSGGYITFNPYEFKEDNFNPGVEITKLMINNKELSYSDSSSILTKPLAILDNIKLSYWQNSIALEVTAMQYNEESRNKYRYKLTGYNDDWINNSDDRKIRFDRLRSGSYTLLINVSNTRGLWSNKNLELKIKVYSPPWFSWWAFALYFLALVAAVVLIWRNYKRTLIRQQNEEFNRRETARLKEIDEIKTRFFSNITHEFRTPLTLILSPLDKHIKDNNFSPKALEILKSNYRHGSHLLKLVNELLDISKLESGSMQLNLATGDAGIFVKGCVDQFQDSARNKDIDLSFINERVTGQYLFDKGHWEKVLLNLLSNALKFTPNGGSVTLKIKEEARTDGDQSKITIEVGDTGIGIEDEALPLLFDRFYQVDGSTTREQEGTGIGLSLVKELVDLMQGTIEVVSDKDIGTTFKICLPVTRLNKVAPPTEPIIIEDRVANISKKADEPLLLVVEDNVELRAFIVESLSEDWAVIEAENGIGGWKLVESELPDIVISDVMMPGMNGLELCQKSKADPRTAHINFIILTAKTAQESKEKGLEAGADDYLTKPFHMYELILRITNLIEQQTNYRNHLKDKLFPPAPVSSQPHVDDMFLEKVYEYLTGNLTNPLLDVESLASEMAMSKSTLNRKLKALLNTTAGDFIKQFRLQKAVEIIVSGHNISKAAYDVGFESPSYFSQCFKEVYNLSPSDYQKTVT